jgi:hypothetical protein
MKTIGFTFNDLDFVIDPFQLTSMEGILTMGDDSTSGPVHTNDPVMGDVVTL